MICGSRLIARGLSVAIALAGCLLAIGCGGSYATPGRGVDLKALANPESLTDASINATLAKRPLATLPCGIAAVRIQATGYQGNLAETYGTGNYCVITTRDVETDDAMKGIQKLPMVAGVAPVNRLLLPQKLNSDLELRQAAAALHADMLLIYTIDSAFAVEDHLAPATVVTLGLSPNMTAQIVTTASAVLMDTRNGYVYGYAEATAHGGQLTNGWMTQEAVNDARARTEKEAFAKLVQNLKVTWTGVVANLSEPQAPRPSAAESNQPVGLEATRTAPSTAVNVTNPSTSPSSPVVQLPTDQPQITSPLASAAAPNSLGRSRDMGLAGNGGHFAAGGAVDPLTAITAVALAGLAVACKASRRHSARVADQTSSLGTRSALG